MPDVTRAVLLPGSNATADEFKNLALYWDEVILAEVAGVPETTPDVFADLEDAGVCARTEFTLAAAGLDDPPRPDSERTLVVERDGEGLPSLALGWRKSDEPDSLPNLTQDEWKIAMGRFAADAFIETTGTVLDHCRASNLAPIASAAPEQLASILGAERTDVPFREASLLSAVHSCFEVDPSTTIEQILRFRDKHAASRARFRASVADLAGALISSDDPGVAMAQAEATVQNRIVPALADLEDALNESRVRFFLRSVAGATSLSLASVAPQVVAASGAQLMMQPINYRFARRALIREHPYAYLHQLGRELDMRATSASTTTVKALSDPRATVRQVFVDALLKLGPDFPVLPDDLAPRA